MTYYESVVVHQLQELQLQLGAAFHGTVHDTAAGDCYASFGRRKRKRARTN